MFKKFLKVSGLLAMMLILVLVSTSCGKPKQQSGEGITTLSIYDTNAKPTNVIFPFGNDDVSKEIIKKTGVTLNYMDATGDSKEKLNLMLASGDYPDIIMIPHASGTLENFIGTKALLPLDDLIEQYGPDIKKQYGEYLDRARSADGKIYGLPNWYGVDPAPILSVLIRYDILSEIAPKEVANGEVPISQDDFLKYLRAFKEKYPAISGKNTTPMTLWAENWGSMVNAFKGMFGIRVYYENPQDGKLYYDFRDPKFKEMLGFVNEIYREGLLDKEWSTNKKQLWQQKLSTGGVMSTIDAHWNVADVNKSLTASNPDKTFLPYKVVANSIDPSKTTYGAKNTMGWDVIAISKTNKNVELTMKFLNYLASEQGQYTVMSGVEGVQYDIVDGVRKLRPEAAAEIKTDLQNYNKTHGIRTYTICVRGVTASDGQPYALSKTVNYDRMDEFAKKTLADSVWDTAQYDRLTPATGSLEALADKKIQDLSVQYITKLINAETTAEFNTLWDQYVAAADSAGAKSVEEIINQNYSKRKTLWNLK